MANNYVTAQELRLVLDYNKETGEFFWRRRRSNQTKQAGGWTGGGYRRITIKDRTYLAHRLAWLYVHGDWPKFVIDHRDGNPANNAISNLRDVAQEANVWNAWKARSNNQSGLLGASWNSRDKTWHAAIRVSGKREFIGCFATAEEAHRAYISRKIELHGLP